MKKCHLRAVGYQDDAPLVQFTKNCWNPNCKNAGNAVDYLNIVTKLINCSWEVLQMDVNSEDTFDLIANGTADITVLPLRQTLGRMKRAYFTTPVSYFYYGYLVKEISQLQVENYFLSAFDPEALALLIAIGIIIGILMFIFSYILNYRTQNVFEWIFTSSRGLIGQFYCRRIGPSASHILIGFWLFFCLIIIHNFQAKLKSFLTLSHPIGTVFTTMNGMIDAILYQGWTLVLQDRGFSPWNYCTADQCRRLNEIPKERIIHVKDDPEFQKMVATPKHVGFIGFTYDLVSNPVSYTDSSKHVIFVRDSEAVPEFLAYAVSKNIPGLREAFNEAVTMSFPAFEAGRGRYMAGYPDYDGNSRIKGEVSVLKNQHLLILYQVTGELFLGALLILSAEFLFFKYGNVVILRFKHYFPRRFSHVLKINGRPPLLATFRRPHTIVLPPRRSPSPVTNVFTKYYTI